MMDDNFIFKGGKHSGKSYGLVRKIDPGYILWCEENAPNMLKEKKDKPIVKPVIKSPAQRIEPPEKSSIPKSAIQPNLNFFFEGPNPPAKSTNSN